MTKTHKILISTSFLLGSILVVLLFITATTYLQLAIAVILYPVIAYYAVNVLSRRARRINSVARTQGKPREEKGATEIIDIDKRTFLKLVGATGIFFFVSSLLGRRVDSLLFNRSWEGRGRIDSPSPDTAQAGGSPAAMGYNISEVDDGPVTYYGFTNKSGAWLIMRTDTSDTSSFRYARGGADFPSNWSRRGDLMYDYYYNLF